MTVADFQLNSVYYTDLFKDAPGNANSLSISKFNEACFENFIGHTVFRVVAQSDGVDVVALLIKILLAVGAVL